MSIPTEIQQLLDDVRAVSPEAADELEKGVLEALANGADQPVSPEKKAYDAKRDESVHSLFRLCDPGVILESVRNGVSPQDAMKLYAATISAAIFTAYDMGADYTQRALDAHLTSRGVEPVRVAFPGPHTDKPNG